MSEYLAAAAQKMGVPEAMVRRSAEARAKATGASVEDILQAWAGGEAAPVTASASASAPAAEPAPASASASEPESAAPPSEGSPGDTGEGGQTPPPERETAPSVAAGDTSPARAGGRVATVPAAPPVLVGRRDRPFVVLAGVIGLALLTLLVGVLAPSSPQDEPGALTSEIAFSDQADAGRDVYLREGCASCHTQMVRTIVADAGLGPVTLSDSNQVLGVRRLGPDLAHIGSRVDDPAALGAALEDGFEGHPRYAGLSDQDLADLVAYLAESK